MKKMFLEKPAVFRFKKFSRKSYAVFASFREFSIGVVMFSVLTFSAVRNTSAQSHANDTLGLSSEHRLEEVKVTASRVELPMSQTVKHLTVISREEIKNAPVQSVQELLNYVSGIDLVQRGGHGVQADVSVRGGSFDQTAILLNGVNISSPQTGHYSFDLPVNLEDIERIEILFGPSSFVHGASALSGGINIITRKTPEHKAYAKLQTGGHQLWSIAGGASLQSAVSTHQLSTAYNKSDGYIPNSDYKILNALWQTRLQIEHSTLDLQLGYNAKRYGANTFYSPLYPNQYEETEACLASVKWQTGTRLKFIPILYWNRHNDCFQLIRGDESTVRYNHHQTDVYGAKLDFQYTSGWGITAFGSEMRNEGVLSTVLGEIMTQPKGKYTHSFDRTNISYMLEHTVKTGKLTITAGIMANYNTQIKNEYKAYPTAGLAYNPNRHCKLYASWSKATRMPTFTDMYYNTRTHTGNIELKPEESESFNLGANYIGHVADAYISCHLTKGKNMIDWVKEDIKWKSYNHATLDTKGMEVGVKLHLNKLASFLYSNTSLQISYARLHQSGDNISEEQSSHYALNYLRDKFTTRLSLPIYKDKLVTYYSFRYQKRKGAYDDYSTAAKPVRTPFPSYSVLDMRVEYKLQKNLRVNLSINNLYNTRYFDLGSIPQAGFWLMGGVGYYL